MTHGCLKLESLDIGYCYRILREGTSFVKAGAFPASVTELILHGVQMTEELLIDVVANLAHIRVLQLCGVQAINDDVLEKVCGSLSILL